MKFDRERNARELAEVEVYVYAVALGVLVASVFHSSNSFGVVLAAIVVARWVKKNKAAKLSGRWRLLVVLIAFALLLGENWASYREGVSDGYDAVAGVKHQANQSLLRTSTSVTPRAGARVAPAALVAGL